MPVLFPRWVADRGTEVGRAIGRRGLGSARLGELWRAYASLAGAENRRAFVRTIRTVIDPGGQTVSALDRLYLAAHLPTLIVWGEIDPIIPVAHAHTAHEAIPGSRLEVLPGVGHFPHAEAPELFLEVLTDFIRTTEPAAEQAPTLHDILRARRPAPALDIGDSTGLT
jgi:pimeloyl-ACP methyl ester carboxylesterase